MLGVAKVSKTTSYWENHSIVVYSLNLFKYLGLFLFAALTAQSGGKAPRSDRADPRVRGYAPPYNPADNVEKCVELIWLVAVLFHGFFKVYPAGHPSQLRCQPATLVWGC